MLRVPSIRIALAAIAAFFGGALLTAAPARATVMVPLSVERSAGRADAIVIARVERVGYRAQMTKSGLEPRTVAVLRVERTLHGQVKGRIAVISLGGRLGDRHVYVSGAARFRVGDRVLVMLERRGTSFRVVGMSQGVWTLRSDRRGQTVAERDRRRVSLLRQGQIVAGRRTTTALPTLITRIQGALRARRLPGGAR